MTPEVSVILPCYRGAEIVQRTVQVLCAYLPGIVSSWELVVVDDGGNDFARWPLPDDPGVRVVTHDRNLGKGAAVRSGMLAATGAVRIYTDVDMPYDRELIAVMCELLATDRFHLVVGDRTLAGSRYTSATGLRALISRVASWVIGSLVTGGFHDTQCGIKGMRGEVADALFPLVRIRGFAFDVEVIYLALKHSLDVKRIPVRLRRNIASSVRPLPDAMRAGRDILRIKWRQLRGEYRSAELDELVARETRDLMRRLGCTPD